MTSLHHPDKALLQHWLDEAGVEHYLCGQCEGLHLRPLQDTPGVIDSRLFQEEFGLLLTTELELRPAMVLQVAAELGRLNMDYPTLKVFIDLVDEALPQLVVAASLLTGAGVEAGQFTHFIATSLEATGHLADSFRQLDYLYPAGEEAPSMLH